MATLEKIRSKGGILVAIFIGFALFAFIMMDFMGSGGSMFSGSQMEVGKINGTSVNIQDFQNKVSEMEEFNKLNQGVSSLSEEEAHSLREQTWNQLVNQTLLQEIYDEIGLKVTSEEIMDMVAGQNIHPAIRQHPLFINQQTGAFDQQQVLNFLMARNQDQMAYFYWMMLEEQLINERGFEKYKNLLEKGMYMPSAWQQSEITSRSRVVDFEFVTARLTSVDDNEVSVTDKEVSDFYRNNQHRYKQDAARDIEYITFDIEPTEEDRQETENWINNMVRDFSNPDIDPVQFVNLNSDEPFTDRNFRASELSSRLESFVTTASVGEVYGPYLEDESYKATRLVAINHLPDSVRARHILIQEQSEQIAHQTADSLIQLIRSGADFAELARQHSMDQGSAVNGGDLGWFREGAMVKPFNDAAFYGSTGDIEKVESQFGLHILHIQQQGPRSPKYKVATLVREINYSSKTYQNIYTEATRFAALNNTPAKFNEAIEEENLVKRQGRNIRKNDRRVGNLQNSRELVRWAYEASPGSMSRVFEFGDQFVIAHLVSATEEGVRPLDAVRDNIERELRNKKKAEYLIAQINEQISSGADLNTLSENFNSEIQYAESVNFASFQVPGAGVEPALVSLAVHSPLNELSGPTRGNNGVYVVQVTNETEQQAGPETIAREFNQTLSMKVDYQLMETIRENAEVVDKRAQFY